MRFAFPVVATLVAMSAIAAAGMRQVQLDSGLTLIAIHDGWCDISAVSVMVDAGSRYDPDERGGLAQLTNEMLFEGTRDATWEEIADELDRLSIRYGALTSEDYAEVYITSHETEFDTALEWLSEFMLRPAFDEERLDREKEIAIGSFESEMNDAFTRTYHSLSGLLFPGHPYSRPVLGTPESVRAATRDEILSFYEQHYGASNTVVVVVGDFDVDEMVAGLEVLFAGYPARDVRRREPSPVELEGPVGLNIYHEGEQGFVEIGFLGPEIGSDARTAVCRRSIRQRQVRGRSACRICVFRRRRWSTSDSQRRDRGNENRGSECRRTRAGQEQNRDPVRSEDRNKQGQGERHRATLPARSPTGFP
jgi:zinc protease